MLMQVAVISLHKQFFVKGTYTCSLENIFKSLFPVSLDGYMVSENVNRFGKA